MKFGMSRASRDAQQDIRRNHITRDEGIALTKRYDGEYPIKYHDWFLKYLDITDDELWGYLDKYRDLSNVWEKKDGAWYLKDAVWYEKDDNKSFSGVKRPQQVHPRENRIDDKRNLGVAKFKKNSGGDLYNYVGEWDHSNIFGITFIVNIFIYLFFKIRD